MSSHSQDFAATRGPTLTRRRGLAHFAWLALAPLAAFAGVPVHAFQAEPAKSAAEAAPTRSLVGVAGRIKDVVLPGTELEAKPPVDRQEPIVLRVLQTYKHGDAYRYDLEYYGLEAGVFDLTNWLRRKDGSPTTDLPKLNVQVVASLPPGQILPHELESSPLPSLGGYRAAVGLGLFAWLAGLWLIFFWGRKRKPSVAPVAKPPATLADRLRPLVERGVRGQLSPGECAELERTLITYWSRKLGLREIRPQDLHARLRTHGEAGPLLERLEKWLHRRPGTTEAVDVESLLAPYRALPADALDGPAARLDSRGAA